jgi:shikimate kinase
VDAAPTRILLTGMMGAGKSTVGRELAKRTGWPFRDNDALLRELTGRAAAEIVEADGEAALHRLEAAAFRAAIERPGPAIIAVAGSVIDDGAERERLAAAGHVVWLRARPAMLRARIGSGATRRADAVDLAWLTARAAEREPRFRAVADQVVEVGSLRPRAIAAAILAAVEERSAG